MPPEARTHGPEPCVSMGIQYSIMYPLLLDRIWKHPLVHLSSRMDVKAHLLFSFFFLFYYYFLFFFYFLIKFILKYGYKKKKKKS